MSPFLRFLRPTPPLRLAASSRRAPSALRRQERLGENAGDFRTCAAARLLHGGGGSTKTLRPDQSCLVGGERSFSSRGNNDGSESLLDAWSSSPQPSEDREAGATDTDRHDSGAVANENPNTPPSDYVLKESARVHPISQLVLLFFQTDEGYDWISSNAGSVPPALRINDDGTFVLTFPSDAITKGTGHAEVDLLVGGNTGPGADLPAQLPKRRIWTQYNANVGRHWLCASVGDKASRFLLQDCSSSARSKLKSLPPANDDMYTPWRVGIHAHPKPTLADHVEDAVRAAMGEVDRALLAG